MSSAPAVTLLLPTRDAGPEFPEVLRRMRAQRLDGDVEILVIDSGSTDGTAEFLRREASTVRLIEIPACEFDHGLTRNLGIREARGEIVVLATQDALPADEQWLPALVGCFADPRVAGAYSRQLPRPDANPFARARLARWMAAAAAPRAQSVASRAEFEALPPHEKLARVTFDNVSSAVRRRVALEIPFRKCRFGEDRDWARRVLLAGYSIVYEPRSRVVHSHNRPLWYEFKRSYLDHHQQRLLGLRPAPGARDLLARSLGETLYLLAVAAREPGLGLVGRARWMGRALPYAVTQNLAQLLGARSVAKLEAGSGLYRRLDRLLARGV